MKKLIIIILTTILLTGCTFRDNNTYEVYVKTYKTNDLINEALGKIYNPCRNYFDEYNKTNNENDYNTCISNIKMIRREINDLNEMMKINSDEDLRNSWSKKYETATTVINDLEEFYNGLYSLNNENISSLSDEEIIEIKNNSNQTYSLAEKLNITWYTNEDSSNRIDTIANNIINFEKFNKEVKTACSSFKTCREKM